MNDMIFKDSLRLFAYHHKKTRATVKNLIVVGNQNDREDEQTEPDNDTDKGRKLHEQSPRFITSAILFSSKLLSFTIS